MRHANRWWVEWHESPIRQFVHGFWRIQLVGVIASDHKSQWNEAPFTVVSSNTGWWFGTFFVFPYIGNNHPNWLIFFRGVQTANQKQIFLLSNPSWDDWSQVTSSDSPAVSRASNSAGSEESIWGWHRSQPKSCRWPHKAIPHGKMCLRGRLQPLWRRGYAEWTRGHSNWEAIKPPIFWWKFISIDVAAMAYYSWAFASTYASHLFRRNACGKSLGIPGMVYTVVNLEIWSLRLGRFHRESRSQTHRSSDRDLDELVSFVSLEMSNHNFPSFVFACKLKIMIMVTQHSPMFPSSAKSHLFTAGLKSFSPPRRPLRWETLHMAAAVNWSTTPRGRRFRNISMAKSRWTASIRWWATMFEHPAGRFLLTKKIRYA